MTLVINVVVTKVGRREMLSDWLVSVGSEDVERSVASTLVVSLEVISSKLNVLSNE